VYVYVTFFYFPSGHQPLNHRKLIIQAYLCLNFYYPLHLFVFFRLFSKFSYFLLAYLNMKPTIIFIYRLVNFSWHLIRITIYVPLLLLFSHFIKYFPLLFVFHLLFFLFHILIQSFIISEFLHRLMLTLSWINYHLRYDSYARIRPLL
jgi:hypothetical protein